MSKYPDWPIYLLFGSLILIPVAFPLADPRNLNPKTPTQIWQNDQDLRDDIKKNIGFAPSKTLAQFKVNVPLKKGLMFFCSDCANAYVCVSTGTTVYGFANMQSANRTTACN